VPPTATACGDAKHLALSSLHAALKKLGLLKKFYVLKFFYQSAKFFKDFNVQKTTIIRFFYVTSFFCQVNDVSSLLIKQD